MKKLRLIIPVLLICFLLNGCGFFMPFFFLNFAGRTTPEEEIVTELPTATEVPSNLSADDVFWRSKLAASDRALQYTTEDTTELTFKEGNFSYTAQLHYNTHVTLDPDSRAVNMQTQMYYDNDAPETYWDYYRDEDGKLAHYVCNEQTGDCTREVIDLQGKTPYVIIQDFSVYGYPYEPLDLSMDSHTRLLDDRQVYVLTFHQTALDAFGYTGNPTRDDKLQQRLIPTTWYVDAETYLPVQMSYSLTQIDDLLGDLIDEIYQFGADGTGCAITGYTYTLKNMAFQDVEVAPIPEDVLKKAWDNAGFSAN